MKGLWARYLGLSCQPDRKGLFPPLCVMRTCKFREATGRPERISSGCGCCSLSRVTAPTAGSSAAVLFKLWPHETWAHVVINRTAQPVLLRNRAETRRWLCVCAPGVLRMGTAGCRSPETPACPPCPPGDCLHPGRALAAQPSAHLRESPRHYRGQEGTEGRQWDRADAVLRGTDRWTDRGI